MFKKEQIDNLDRATSMMVALGIPIHGNELSHWSEIYAIDLYDIFMDEEKLRALVSKIRNKAFW